MFLLEYPWKEEYVMIVIIFARFLVRVWSNSGGRAVGCWGVTKRIRYGRLELDLDVLDMIILRL